MEQIIFEAVDNYSEVDKYIAAHSEGRIFLVCGKSFERTKFYSHLKGTRVEIDRFSDFRPNPTYESVTAGVEEFLQSEANFILAAGGGSALDVAKCIKLYSGKNPKLFAMPTTAGTGSEATKFAVIYKDGEKQSVTDESIIPDAVLFDSSALDFLPMYHRKAAMLDALCHGIESFWSVNATPESRILSEKAITGILAGMEDFLKNDGEANKKMLAAANTAGRAINMTQTTAGHAMCYKLTSLYGIAHGYAAALCVDVLWSWMEKNCAEKNLRETLSCLGKILSADDFRKILDDLKLGGVNISSADIEYLSSSVNPVRLKNHPVTMTKETIRELYETIGKRNKADES